MDFAAQLKQYQEYLYSELSKLQSNDKHNRTLMEQKSEQLSKLLDLIDSLEEEATKYELMKDTHLELERIETVEYPSCFN
jgi:flagellar biosynthesis/type III secretory pathway chaperone